MKTQTKRRRKLKLYDLFEDCGTFLAGGGFVYVPVPVGTYIEEWESYNGDTGETDRRYSATDEPTWQDESSWNNRSSRTVRFWRVIEAAPVHAFDAEDIANPDDRIGDGDDYLIKNGKYTYSCDCSHYYDDVPGCYPNSTITIETIAPYDPDDD